MPHHDRTEEPTHPCTLPPAPHHHRFLSCGTAACADALEVQLECEFVTFVRQSSDDLTFYAERPPGEELLRMTYAQLMQSQTLHERLCNKKPLREPYPSAGSGFGGMPPGMFQMFEM
jgi:hypothetical protein